MKENVELFLIILISLIIIDWSFKYFFVGFIIHFRLLPVILA